jgi:hypothetical protein
MTQVIIREVFKRTEKHNPISGHRWIEHGDTTGYQVIGAGVIHSRHKTNDAAEKARESLQAFYNKFNL